MALFLGINVLFKNDHKKRHPKKQLHIKEKHSCAAT
jgi:hypothetical protein